MDHHQHRAVFKPFYLAILVALSVWNSGYAKAADATVGDGDTVLGEVEVTAEETGVLPSAYAGGQVARGGRLGMLGNADVMDAPFSIISYTEKMIEDQQAVTAADVLEKDASVRMTAPTGGILDTFYMRGFPIGEGNLGELAFDGVYGIAPNYRVFTDYAERIEAIKGPGAMLYGISPNSAVGGVINIVPKRAGSKDLTRLTLDYATESQVGAHLDVGRRFGAGREFGVRVNGSYHEGDTPLDNQSREADIGSIALDFQGERLRASLDLLAQKERFDAPSRSVLIASGVAVPDAPDGENNVTQKWEYASVQDRSALFKAEYDLNKHLTVFANIGESRTEVDRLFGTPTITNAAGNTSTRPDRFMFDIERSTHEAGMRAQFETGALSHQVTLQASNYDDRIDRGSRNGTNILSNIYDPVDRAEQNVAEPTSVAKLSENRLIGIALADTMSAFDDQVQLTLGVRKQRVKTRNYNTATGAVTSTYDEDAITPLAGIVVKPWSHVSVYGNYIEGLSKGDIAPASAVNAGETFSPYKSKQREVGIKIDHGRMMTSLSLFHITKPSAQTTNNIVSADAEQLNRGIELNAWGELATGIRLMGGVTLIDAELTKTNSATTRGNRPVGVPSSQASANLEWDLPWVPNLTLTGATIYTGEQYVNAANTTSIPSWVRFDLGTRYVTVLSGKETTFRANVINVFDRDYWSGVASFSTIAAGAPRTLMLSATIDF